MAGLESSIAELPNMFLISTDLAMEPSDCLIYLAKQVIFLHFFLPKLYRLNLIDSLFFSFDLHDRKCTEGSLIKEIQRFIWEHCVLKPHIQELLQYVQYVLWWTALGVASSIGLGSGLHTFVLYLGPHIALFTIKAMQCGRVDLKSAPYDTIQLNHGPSWLDKDCSEFGPPLFESLNGSSVPLSSILPQVQLEAMLWGLGTALGELPPYFISRAASLAGSEVDPMEELGVPLAENSWSLNALFNRSKLWFISHAQYLNFLTVLLLASVPNPLFDLAGILCGQFGVPFWEFFFATLIGKALVKTHIQTVVIISICNNQLLHWVENELIWALSFIPGISSALPTMIAKLHAVKDKYQIATPPGPPHTKANRWRLSFSSIWNTVVWLVLVNFFFKIVNSIAQGFLKKQQEEELVVASKKKKPLSTY